MAKKMEVYKCEICGNIVLVVHGGKGELVCCGKPMILQESKTEDEGQEKHVPVVEETPEGTKVKVGSVSHPMMEKHYIEWIEVQADGKVFRNFLSPDDEPAAYFDIDGLDIKEVRIYCNIHGLWKAR